MNSKSLFRFRPLDDGLLERELTALTESYLYSPSFEQLNDPMEAFFPIAEANNFHERPGDTSNFAKSLLSVETEATNRLAEMVRRSGVVSFAGSHTNFPLWAYYASNFSGFCLEFEEAELRIGDLKGALLTQVTYAQDALPTVRILKMLSASDALETFRARLSRKRFEWSHEEETRFISHRQGPHYFVDDALKRVYLGPRVKQDHANALCSTLSKRPVEILQGETSGFDLCFRVLQKPCSLDECDRVGEGRFDAKDAFYSEDHIRGFLSVPFDRLIAECERIRRKPNLDHFPQIGVSSKNKDALYIQAAFKLRNGRIAHQTYYFDSAMRPVEDLP